MSGTLSNGSAEMLGVDSGGTSAGEGAVWRLESTWSWAPWATLLLLAFIVAWVAYFYAYESPSASRRVRALLSGVRIVTFGLLLFMLAEPVVSIQRTGRPNIALLIDDSESMSIVDRYGTSEHDTAAERDSPSRLDMAKRVLLENDAALLSRLQRDYRLHTYFVSADRRPFSGDLSKLASRIRAAEPSGEASSLGAGLRSVLKDLRGSTPAAVLYLTDGVTTDGESLSSAAREARRQGVPVFAVGLGSDQKVRDVMLSEMLVDEFVFVNDAVNFQCTLSAHGLSGREVVITLRRADEPKVLAKAKVTLSADGQPQKVWLPYRPGEVGQFEYVMEIDPLEDEVQTDNNQMRRIVSARDQQLRVLLASAQPSYEFRYLKHLLERDPTIRLSTVLQDADVELQQIDATALQIIPVRRDDLFAYDVILFADVNPALLTHGVMENIVAFVREKGGGIVFVSGPQFVPLAYQNTPLATLFPIDLNTASIPLENEPDVKGFRVRPTDLGLSSAHMQLGDTLAETVDIWNRLPSMYWMLKVSRLKPAARVLAEHPTMRGENGQPCPVFCSQYVGAGKVLFHAIDSTWRWRFRIGDVYLARYWIQTIRMLAHAKLAGESRAASMTADRREYRRGEDARLRVRFADERHAPTADDGVTLVVETEGQSNRRLQLIRSPTNRGVFEGTLPGLTEGAYHVWMAVPASDLASETVAPSADFLVTAPSVEFERLAADFAELADMAKITGGRFYDIQTVDRLIEDLSRGRPVPIESLPPALLWNRWWILLVFLTLLVVEWVLRKRSGLL